MKRQIICGALALTLSILTMPVYGQASGGNTGPAGGSSGNSGTGGGGPGGGTGNGQLNGGKGSSGNGKTTSPGGATTNVPPRDAGPYNPSAHNNP
jgi:hypothetical protein